MKKKYTVLLRLLNKNGSQKVENCNLKHKRIIGARFGGRFCRRRSMVTGWSMK